MICHLICGKKLVCAKFGRFPLHHLLHQRVHIDGDGGVVVWILQTKQKLLNPGEICMHKPVACLHHHVLSMHFAVSLKTLISPMRTSHSLVNT